MERTHPRSLLQLEGLPSVNSQKGLQKSIEMPGAQTSVPNQTLTSSRDSGRDAAGGVSKDGAGGSSHETAPSAAPQSMPGQYSTLMPALMTLKGQIMGELEANLPRLFSLNPSRREAIAQYLDRLAGIAPGPSASAGVADTAGGLRRWVEGPRSPAQNAALRAYFEEVALLVVGQAILLKSWSDRAVRVWTEADLGRLNWALSTTLKPHMPVDREGWQITRPNLYSWYNPGSTVRAQLWTTLENSRATAEGPGLLSSIMGPARQALPDVKHPHGYDARFFQAIWGSCAHFGNNPNEDSSPLRRTRMVFSPTLRRAHDALVGPERPSALVAWNRA